MTRYVFKMPDLGEGTVEAEVVAWHIKVGDMVQEDQVMAEVMTVTARPRRPHSTPCTRSISGQLATTTMVAQINGPRKGRRIHRAAASSRPMNSTPKVTRARSLAPGGPLRPDIRAWSRCKARR